MGVVGRIKVEYRSKIVELIIMMVSVDGVTPNIFTFIEHL